jgi:hypothetical protein
MRRPSQKLSPRKNHVNPKRKKINNESKNESKPDACSLGYM